MVFSTLCALFDILDKLPASPVLAMALPLVFRTALGSPCI